MGSCGREEGEGALTREAPKTKGLILKVYWSTWPAEVLFNSKQDNRFVVRKDSPEAERSHWSPGRTWQGSGGVSSFQQVPRNYSSVFLVLSSINGRSKRSEGGSYQLQVGQGEGKSVLSLGIQRPDSPFSLYLVM